MKKWMVFLLVIGVVIALVVSCNAWKRASEQRLHVFLREDQVVSMKIWGSPEAKEPVDRMATKEEISQIIRWFNAATDIRANKEFAGSTPMAGIQITLQSGKRVGIIRSGKDFEVQRDDGMKDTISYWAKQNDIRDFLNELAK